MKLRALILIIILIGGTYSMLQSKEKENEFNELFHAINSNFVSISFSIPASLGFDTRTWESEDKTNAESLFLFLQDYHIRKLPVEDVSFENQSEQFIISIQDDSGNMISLIVDEALIIKNGKYYYEIIDGPLDKEWLVQFFINNQL